MYAITKRLRNISTGINKLAHKNPTCTYQYEQEKKKKHKKEKEVLEELNIEKTRWSRRDMKNYPYLIKDYFDAVNEPYETDKAMCEKHTSIKNGVEYNCKFDPKTFESSCRKDLSSGEEIEKECNVDPKAHYAIKKLINYILINIDYYVPDNDAESIINQEIDDEDSKKIKKYSKEIKKYPKKIKNKLLQNTRHIKNITIKNIKEHIKTTVKSLDPCEKMTRTQCMELTFIFGTLIPIILKKYLINEMIQTDGMTKEEAYKSYNEAQEQAKDIHNNWERNGLLHSCSELNGGTPTRKKSTRKSTQTRKKSTLTRKKSTRKSTPNRKKSTRKSTPTRKKSRTKKTLKKRNLNYSI